MDIKLHKNPYKIIMKVVFLLFSSSFEFINGNCNKDEWASIF